MAAMCLFARGRFVPNLIIMDIQLPNVSGLELIEALKGDPDLRADPGAGRYRLCRQGRRGTHPRGGAEGYLAKPVSIASVHDGCDGKLV